MPSSISIFLVLILGFIAAPSQAASQQQSAVTGVANEAAIHDAQHDFDFDFGVWKTHTSRLMHPLTGSTTWADMDGITVVKKVWDGRANIAEYKADGPAGHVELISLRWYNPAAHQWNLDFATPNVGTLGVPMFGEFKNGRADFYDQEPLNGKTILVRFSIWSITSNTAQSEQAFSADGGKTWEVNWVNKYTRANEQLDIDWRTSNSPEQEGQHGFALRGGDARASDIGCELCSYKQVRVLWFVTGRDPFGAASFKRDHERRAGFRKWLLLDDN